MNNRRTSLSDSPLPPSALVHASRTADRESIAPPELGPLWRFVLLRFLPN